MDKSIKLEKLYEIVESKNVPAKVRFVAQKEIDKLNNYRNCNNKIQKETAGYEQYGKLSDVFKLDENV